jgi:hypothetical protein
LKNGPKSPKPWPLQCSQMLCTATQCTHKGARCSGDGLSRHGGACSMCCVVLCCAVL